MSKRNVTEQLLRYLATYGVGFYTEISPIIRDTFPPLASDKTDEVYDQRIREYLQNLEADGYIKCNAVVITRQAIYIEAAILAAGYSHMQTEKKSGLYKFIEFLFWIAGIGVLVMMLYEHFHPAVAGK